MAKKGYSFGTFQGVFIPSLLTILGVIMYLRFGWVLGNVGLWQTLLIVTMATMVTFTTSLSLATLVTNSQTGTGGAYYVISRSLGIEAGAAIGFPLYCAQALSIAFYVSGFAESLVAVFPMLQIKLIAIATILIITILVYFSADIALKTQLIILILIVGSLVSFFLGNTTKIPPVPLDFQASTVPFWAVFAVFFPAVTGITAGLGLSGDLKNPARSLTWGTLAAVLVSYGIYMTIPFFLNKIVPDRNMLLSNSMIMADIAIWKWAVIAGIWGATLSSAIGSILTAPRTMQALSNDKILPRFLGRGFGESNDPRIAIALSFCIGLVGVILGDLNLIAPILSMFFLTTYGLINLSAAFEGLIGSPWWRPTFKIHWSVSLFGAFICLGTMLMIDAGSSFIAIFFSLGVYFFTKRRRLRAHWGDARAGILMWIAQNVVYKLSRKKPDERTWRPNILVFAGAPSSRWYLIALADALTRGRGMMTTVSILPHNTKQARIANLEGTIRSFLAQKKVESLVKVIRAKNLVEGACNLINTYGFGPIFPNTIMIGDPSEDEPIDAYSTILFTAIEQERNLIIVKEGEERELNKKEKKQIDVWWDHESDNAGLLLALAFLMRASDHWYNAQLNIRTILSGDNGNDKTSGHIQSMVGRMRLKANIITHENKEHKSHLEILSEHSKKSTFVLLGLHSPLENETSEQYQSYISKVLGQIKYLPPTALVMARENIEFDHLFIE